MRYHIDFQDPAVISELVKIMIANTPVAYIILDRNFQVHFINEYFLKLRRLQKEDVLGKFCYSLSNNGIPCPVCAVRDAIETGEKTQLLRRDVLPDGTVRYIDDYAIPIYKEDGKSFDYILEIMINSSTEMLLRERTNEVLYDIVKTLTAILDKKDAYTSTHSSDVSSISMKLAKFAKLPEDEIYRVGLAGLLHDIGKVYVPDELLNKPSKLSSEEFDLIRTHPAKSYELLRDLESFQEIVQMSRSHHERWDGRGYPDGLQGENILFGSRILSIADTYDAMTSDRSYRKGLSHEVAVEEIRNNAGGQFDPGLAELFYELATKIFPSRQALIEKGNDAIDEFIKTNELSQVARVIQAAVNSPKPSGPEITAEQQELYFEKMLSDDAFAYEIFNNTPAFYTIISEAFDVLYVSQSTADALGVSPGDLVGCKCFEINNKNMSCFRPTEHGVACPVVRAFQTGKEQRGTVTERFGDKVLHMDIFAVPIELTDKDGKKVKCALEILFDRTEDREVQFQLERDIKALLNLLESLATSLDMRTTRNTHAIINECDSFIEYLSNLEQEIKKAQLQDV